MGEPRKEISKLRTAGKYLARLAIASVCLVVLIALACTVYLATPLPARHVSELVTSYLHQGFSAQKVLAVNGTLYLKGVRLDNPAGFPKESLATADSVAIAPQWGDLVLGRQRFRLISLEGIRINLQKNAKGDWNYSRLQQLLSGKKATPAETRIRQFSVKDGSLRVAGQEVRGIALQIFNLATKGSHDSRIDLGFEDAAHNHFALSGQGRAGTDPALDLTLAAPALTLPGVAASLGLPKPDLLAGGGGSLRVSAGLHRGELGVTGELRFSGLHYAAQGKSYPLDGSLEFAADYSLQRDAAHLKSCLLRLRDLAQLHAAGTLQGVRKERNFALELGFNEIDLRALNALVPEKTRRDLVLGGRLDSPSLRAAGKGRKLTSVSGTLRLRDGALSRGGRLLVAGLAGEAGFSSSAGAVSAKGRLSLAGPHGTALLEALDLPFELSLSPALKPLKAVIPSLSAQLMGIPCSGRLGFDAARPSPLSASLAVPVTGVSALNPLLERFGLVARTGVASVTLEAAGSSPQQLEATVGVRLADFQGKRGDLALALKKGVVSAEVRRGAGQLSVQGEAQLRGASYDGKGGDARLNFRVADQSAYLDGADFSGSGTELSIAHLRAAIPVLRSVGKGSSLPVALDFDGCSVKTGGLEVSSLAGRLRGALLTDPAGRWLEGSADLASGRVAWQGKPVGSPTVRAAFARQGARGELGGKLLGGALAGLVSGNPFAPASGASFELRLKDAGLVALSPLLPKGRYTLSDGVVQLTASGSYARRDALACRLEAQGSRIALAGAGGKTLVSGAALSLAGELAGDRLSIGDALLSPGPGVALRVKGELAHPFAPGRAGSLSFTLAETAAGSIVDPLVNLLPRVIQEATIDGTLTVQGALELRGGEKLLEGALVFKGGRFELPQQKLVVSGINGRFPFSVDLSGKAGGKPPASMMFSRENFPNLMSQLSRAGGAGESLTVAKIGFGPMELGALTMHATAQHGTTEISSLNSSLYEGALLGKGFLTMREGLTYRGDLLLNGLSLKELCSIFPNINGYISGRVDGVISIGGGAGGLAGLSGFTELWAREGGGEKMLVSKEFLQRLAKQKLGGFFFRSDRSYDEAEIKALMEQGYLSFETLKIVHTNLFGVRDLNVSIAPTQNRIALDHLLESVKQAAVRGKSATPTPAPAAGEPAPAAGEPAAPATQEFKWGE